MESFNKKIIINRKKLLFYFFLLLTFFYSYSLLSSKDCHQTCEDHCVTICELDHCSHESIKLDSDLKQLKLIKVLSLCFLLFKILFDFNYFPFFRLKDNHYIFFFHHPNYLLRAPPIKLLA